MHIQSIELEPIHQVEFLNSGRKKNDPFIDALPVYVARTHDLPDQLDALLITADLQGRELPARNQSQPLRLIGELLPEKLEEVFAKLGMNDRSRIGAILAGDLYTVPNCTERGGTGDVTEVWNQFSIYRWVVGVAGNHDTFGTHDRPPRKQGRHFLSADLAEVDGIRFAGLGGVVGNPKRNQRRNYDKYMDSLRFLLSEPNDMLVMHEGPKGDSSRYPGYIDIREIIESYPKRLVIRGHKHWPEPLIELDNGTQVLNVEATVVVLTR